MNSSVLIFSMAPKIKIPNGWAARLRKSPTHHNFLITQNHTKCLTRNPYYCQDLRKCNKSLRHEINFRLYIAASSAQCLFVSLQEHIVFFFNILCISPQKSIGHRTNAGSHPNTLKHVYIDSSISTYSSFHTTFKE